MCHHFAWNCISALLSFTYRTKPPLHSGLVGRPQHWKSQFLINDLSPIRPVVAVTDVTKVYPRRQLEFDSVVQSVRTGSRPIQSTERQIT